MKIKATFILIVINYRTSAGKCRCDLHTRWTWMDNRESSGSVDQRGEAMLVDICVWERRVVNESVWMRECQTERGREKAQSCSEETGAIKKEHVFTEHINLGDVSSWICTRFSFLLDLLSLVTGKPAPVPARRVVLGPLTPWLWQLVSAPC